MLHSLFGLVYVSAVLLLISLTGIYTAECPVEINPQRVVVRYGSSVSVDCSTNITHYGMGWEASEGPVPMSRDKLVTWRVSNLTHWEIEPQCFINYEEQCEVYLPVTVYKTPDSVSISTIDHTGPMTENTQYQLQCDIVNVAPVKNLIVKWYKGETLVHQETFIDTIKTPVNKTSTLQITPDRDDDGVQYRCEAELDLGADGPQPLPTVTSKRIQITVLYKPKHKVTNEIITADEGVILNCTVAANPPAAYVWHSDHLKERRSSSVLSSSTLSPGNYTCTATNRLGRSSLTFTLRSGGRGTFWAILLSGLGVLVLLILSYTIYKCTCSKNSVI